MLYTTPRKGDQLIVKHDCVCAHYEHEATNYPRAGLVKKELKAGDTVTFIEIVVTFYGTYYRVTKEGDDYLYDIRPSNFH